MADLISRQDAIDAILKADCGCGIDSADVIRKLPSAQKKGKWKLQEDKTQKLYGWHFCSKCGAWIGEPTNFCSNCGARMERGDKDE